MTTTTEPQATSDALLTQFTLMADYNQWMNERLYAVCGALTADQLRENVGAFFGSILGTLNHIMVGDLLWLRRFSAHPAPATALERVPARPPIETLDQRLYNDLHALRNARSELDAIIVDWSHELTLDALAQSLAYRTTGGREQRRNFALLVQHFFNHQTHHRGQLTTLLSQRRLDPGDTDLLNLIPNLP